MTPNWRTGARGRVLGISKTRTLKEHHHGTESWEQVKDGWETMNKFIECKEIFEQMSAFQLDSPKESV